MASSKSLPKCVLPVHIPLILAAAAAKLLQSCLTLCDPIDSSLPGSAVPGIIQARTMQCLVLSYSVKPPQPGSLAGPVRPLKI